MSIEIPKGIPRGISQSPSITQSFENVVKPQSPIAKKPTEPVAFDFQSGTVKSSGKTENPFADAVKDALIKSGSPMPRGMNYAAPAA